MRRLRSLQTTAVPVALAMALVVSACGGDGAVDPDTGPPAEEAAGLEGSSGQPETADSDQAGEAADGSAQALGSVAGELPPFDSAGGGRVSAGSDSDSGGPEEPAGPPPEEQSGTGEDVSPPSGLVEPSGAAPPGCPAPDGPGARYFDFDGPQPMCIDPGARYVAVFDTSEGEMRFELTAGQTPGTVNNFVTLARWGYYHHTLLFRTDPSIDIIQGGSPHTNSASDPGPGYTIPDEPAFEADPATGQPVGPYRYGPGQLVMARSAGVRFRWCPVLHHHRPERLAAGLPGHVRGVRQHRRRGPGCGPVDHRPACGRRQPGRRAVAPRDSAFGHYRGDPRRPLAERLHECRYLRGGRIHVVRRERDLQLRRSAGAGTPIQPRAASAAGRLPTMLP